MREGFPGGEGFKAQGMQDLERCILNPKFPLSYGKGEECWQDATGCN